jgi:hypothetical protein
MQKSSGKNLLDSKILTYLPSLGDSSSLPGIGRHFLLVVVSSSEKGPQSTYRCFGNLSPPPRPLLGGSTVLSRHLLVVPAREGRYYQYEKRQFLKNVIKQAINQPDKTTAADQTKHKNDRPCSVHQIKRAAASSSWPSSSSSSSSSSCWCRFRRKKVD